MARLTCKHCYSLWQNYTKYALRYSPHGTAWLSRHFTAGPARKSENVFSKHRKHLPKPAKLLVSEPDKNRRRVEFCITDKNMMIVVIRVEASHWCDPPGYESTTRSDTLLVPLALSDPWRPLSLYWGVTPVRWQLQLKQWAVSQDIWEANQAKLNSSDMSDSRKLPYPSTMSELNNYKQPNSDLVMALNIKIVLSCHVKLLLEAELSKY